MRARRYAAYALFPGELALLVCLVAGVRIPVTVLVAAEAAVGLVAGAHLVSFLRLWRRGGSARDAVREVVPEPVLRLAGHELRLFASLGRWVARRPHGIRDEGAAAFPYARDQAALMYGFAFVCGVETVGMAYLLAGLPVVHAVFLVLDGYTVLFVLGLHAASATRPHVLTADALRVRQAAHVDVRIPLDRIATVRRESLFSHEKAAGELNLAIGARTSLTLELAEPVAAPRLLGAARPVRVVRLHADDPTALHRALTKALAESIPEAIARTGPEGFTPTGTAPATPSPVPGPPASA
ncbi:hypothetical protein ABZ990_19900 [Streptomyces sp. NPDC046203]|uniref:hypothetical protein n=1 Tax=Streptomyces sp. NPDC046203 TaxID=3154602 RepID=UPI0033D64CE6